VFSYARYLIPQKDWDHYTRPELAERTAYLRNTIELERLGHVDLVEGARSITSEVGLAPAPGHTPGHQVVLLGPHGDRGAIIGDAAHTPAQLQETGWSPQVDFDPEMAANTRAALADRIERTGGVLCAGHFPHPGMGQVVREDGLRVFRPL
ncbi:MAG: MBL fold metallo-hydrolase, partial [Chloroflexota bacterium]